MEPQEYHLDQTIEKLSGPSPEQIKVFNQWCAVALDKYHQQSSVQFEFVIDKKQFLVKLKWDSEFSKDAMKEKKKIAEEGGVALAFFVMSVLQGYSYVNQSEIGEGVDYGFTKNKPSTDNFFQDCHYIEVSALLEENGANTLDNRIKKKHQQIVRGSRNGDESSVIITLFNKPVTIKEIHV